MSAVLSIIVGLFLIGTEEGKPLIGFRRFIIKNLAMKMTRLGLFLGSFIWISRVNDEIDYSEWLGLNYKEFRESKENQGRAPIIIMNHLSWTVLF